MTMTASTPGLAMGFTRRESCWCTCLIVITFQSWTDAFIHHHGAPVCGGRHRV